ncbi:MAG TPA: SET domain-containing protein-lysine N-methyltransferase [Pyrinomonadaceae bacterium]|nr:SET domain-containing protein-lysine N-methyltransferase [Pyrinomonadaceae bacterium]
MRSNAVVVRNDVESGSAIEVRDNNGVKGVFATGPIKEDSIIFRLRGTITTKPSKYTIQLGWHRHLNFPALRKANDDTDYCWQFLNHSCEPNGYIDVAGLTFRALRDIAPGEEISFNYLTTESEMAEPFKCVCGSANCFGLIRGRNFLTDEESERLASEYGEDNLVTLFMPAAGK